MSAGNGDCKPPEARMTKGGDIPKEPVCPRCGGDGVCPIEPHPFIAGHDVCLMGPCPQCQTIIHRIDLA